MVPLEIGRNVPVYESCFTSVLIQSLLKGTKYINVGKISSFYEDHRRWTCEAFN